MSMPRPVRLPAEPLEAPRDAVEAQPARRRRRWRRVLVVFAVLGALLVAGRAALPEAVRWYVHRALDQNHLYDGRIGDIDVHLWRGAYSIEDVQLLDTKGGAPAPFFSASRVDLAIEWAAVWDGELVGRVTIEDCEINFVAGEDRDQTGAGAPWLQVVRDLFPFRINSAEIRNGAVHFRAPRRNPPVDVYVRDIELSLVNLTNTHEDVTPMFATLEAQGIAMDHAPVELDIRLDPQSYRPTFHLAARLVGLDVRKTNDLARAYGSFDFEHGWLDLVLELDVKEGRVEGYVRPLFRDLRVVDVRRDLEDANVLQLFWEALVGTVAGLFRNWPRDQFGTEIPIRGDLDDPRTDLLAAIGNILRNAFVRAYLPTFRGVGELPGGIAFGTGKVAPADMQQEAR
jgi:hypothetical protein